MPAITPRDLRALLPQHDISDDTADLAIKLARSWLKRATRLPVLPDALPDELWAPGLELAGLVASNPESLASRTAGPTSRAWPLASRRDGILAEVRADAARAAGGPRGHFPPPAPYPDPAVGLYVRTWPW